MLQAQFLLSKFSGQYRVTDY